MVSRRVRFSRWWRRSGMGLRVSVFILGFIFLSLLFYWQQPRVESASIGTNLVVFGLVHFNLIILFILAFLVGRNVVKLVFDRRRNILGSKLRLRLVVAFVGLALVPTVILFSLASGLLTQAMEGWFSSQVEHSVNGAVDVARHHYNVMKGVSARLTRRLAIELRDKPLLYNDEALLLKFLKEQRKENDLFTVAVLRADGQYVAEATHIIEGLEEFAQPRPDLEALKQALAGRSLVLLEERNNIRFIRSYNASVYNNTPVVLVTTLRVSSDLSQAMAVVNDSFQEYEQLKLFKAPLQSGYMLTLAMITGLIIFSAIWIGFYIARELSGPIQRLAEGMGAVARGNYDVHLRAVGDDEVAFLMKSFNQMTSDLKHSRSDAERRRVFIETTLSKLAVGVIGVDMNGYITSINNAAVELFLIEDPEASIGAELSTVLPNDALAPVETLLVEGAGDVQAAELELNLNIDGSAKKIICTIGRIKDEESRSLGTVLLFDDVTELVKAQQMSAWREVARRVAHEIKNPLTPIQLCAQRLQKLFEAQETDSAAVESAQTIVEHVNSIKRLANEFSHFSRMPPVEFHPVDVNELVSDLVASFADNHPEIVFQFIAGSNLPAIEVDAEHLRRALINLMDNAVMATSDQKEGGRILIRTTNRPEREEVRLEVIDNGSGITSDSKQKIFEPYFTTKEQGTGLGLAIVSSVVSDHQGEIRIQDAKDGGTRVVIDLPVQQREVTTRRFAR